MYLRQSLAITAIFEPGFTHGIVELFLLFIPLMIAGN